MKPLYLFFAVSTGIAGGTLVTGMCSAAVDFEELEHKAIKYRLENTKTGLVRIHVINEVGPATTEFLHEVTFDEHRVSRIRRGRHLGTPQWGNPDKVVVTPEEVLWDPGPDFSLTMAPKENYSDPARTFSIPNVRALGMSLASVSALHSRQIETLLEALMNRVRSGESDRTVRRERVDGVETWRVDYRMQSTGRRISVWIAPERGFSVVRLESESHTEKKTRLTIQCQLQQYPIEDIWYPSRVEYTRERDGRVVRRQVVVVEEARFGGPLDDTEFGLAGMDLKPGRDVTDTTSGMPWGRVWDGKNLVDPITLAQFEPDVSQPWSPTVWLMLGLVHVVLLSLLVVTWWMKRRETHGRSVSS